MTIYCTPYTYLIIWSKMGIKYYGVRYRKKCNPSDLWKSYFTSSLQVIAARYLYGEPDIIQIRKIFSGDNAINKARLWEHKVLRRMHVIERADYLNKSDSKSIDPKASSKARTGVSPGNKGKPQPEHIKDKKRKPKPKVTCPHCGKIGGISAMIRHHFDNCGKEIKQETLSKLQNINSEKANRPMVIHLKEMRKKLSRDERHSLDKQANFKAGWYQLSDDILSNAIRIHESYLSSRNDLNLGNLKL